MVVGIPPDPDKGKVGVEVRVAIFFDGTLNNRYNTSARLNHLSAATQLGGWHKLREFLFERRNSGIPKPKKNTDQERMRWSS